MIFSENMHNIVELFSGIFFKKPNAFKPLVSSVYAWPEIKIILAFLKLSFSLA